MQANVVSISMCSKVGVWPPCDHLPKLLWIFIYVSARSQVGGVAQW